MLVFAVIPVVYSLFVTLQTAKWLVFAWIAAGTLTGAWGLVQFARDVALARAAHADFYHFYIADRIRGFMSHWMTFSGQELFILLIACAFLLFGPNIRRLIWLWLPCAGVVGTALLGFLLAPR